MKKSKFGKALVIALVTVILIVCTGCASAESAMEEKEESTVENSESPDSSTVFSADEAIAIAEEGFKAMREKDAERMVKYINMEVFYYIANGEYIDGEKLVAELAAVMSESESDEGYNDLGIVGNYSTLENVEFYDAQLFSTDELGELNEFISNDDTILWGEAESLEYNIESAYKLKLNYDGIEEESIEEGNEPYVLVVCANGEWKLDICISVMKDVYDVLSEIGYGE